MHNRQQESEKSIHEPPQCIYYTKFERNLNPPSLPTSFPEPLRDQQDVEAVVFLSSLDSLDQDRQNKTPQPFEDCVHLVVFLF